MRPPEMAPNLLISPTSSHIVTETIYGSHPFVLQDYSMAKGMGIGKRIVSDDFIVGGCKWAIHFYPDGQNPEDNSTYVSVFIALVSEGSDVRALFQFTLLDLSGRGKHKVYSHFDRSLESGPYTFKYRGSMWGYKRFFRRDLLESSDFLKDDCLKITCTVGVVVSAVDCSRLHLIQVPDSDIESDFGMLLENMEGSDVTYSVAGEKFHAHKLVLAARSPVFSSKFFEELDSNGQDITVSDMEPKVFKINDRYEFPLELDLDRENGKYLSPEVDRSIRNVYTLHSVLVHSGGLHGGHDYAFIRPTLSDRWYKFDDERVMKEYVKRALEEQYGGEEELPQMNPGYNSAPFKFTKFSNAYLLVYIRVSDKDKIICDVDEKDIAEHLRIRLKKEQEEKEDKRRYKAQAHLYTIIKVARDEDLREQIGKDIYFDLVDHDKVHSFPIQKQMPFNLFKEEVAKKFGIPVQFQHFLLWAKRQNHTYHSNQPLTLQEEAQTIRECDGLSSLMLMLLSEDDVVRYEAVEAIGDMVHLSPNIKKEVLASKFCLENPREAVLLLGQFLGSDKVVKGHIQIPPSIEISDSLLKSQASFALERHLYRCGTPRPSTVDQIVSLLEYFESNNDVKQHEASFALYGIIDSEENVPDFVRVGGVQKLQEDGFILLQQIRVCIDKTMKRVEQHINEQVVLDRLLDMMCVENQIIQTRVVLALAHLCSPHDIRKIFLEKNGLLLLLELLNSEHRRESCLALCSLTDKIRQISPKESAPSPMPNSSILFDVLFVVEGELFYGYKNYLCQSSKVFWAMFNGEFLERDAEKIVIPNISSDVFELMMSHIYTGATEVSFCMAHDLARAADQYMLTSLKELCEDTILKELTIDNVHLMYELSDLINGIKLRSSCIFFVLKNYDLSCRRVWFPRLMEKICSYLRGTLL